MSFTEEGMSNVLMPVPDNTASASFLMPCGIFICWSAEQPLKAWLPMLSTVDGITKCSNLLHNYKCVRTNTYKSFGQGC